MSDQLVVQSAQPKSVSTYTILANGNQLSDSVDVLSIVVNKEVNRIPSATILIKDGSAAERGFAVSNGEDLKPGNSIEIKAGYRNDEETIFSGLIIKHSVKVRQDISVLKIECRHQAIKMTLKLNSAYYYEQSDLEIAEQLCQNHGLTPSVSGDTPTHEEIVQYDSTDWDFMLCRAEANGLWVIPADGGNIEIKKPDFGQEPALQLEYGATIKELDAEIDARLQYNQVKAISWNAADQALLDQVEASDPGVPPAGNISSSDLANTLDNASWTIRHISANETELKSWADGRWQKQKLGKIRGKMKIDGTERALPGVIIEMTNVGERFEGKVMATGVSHVLEKSNWETHIQFGESPRLFAQQYRISQPRAAALLPPVSGLQIGVVTALENDPQGEDRIQVRLPIVDNANDGIWMRLACQNAGADRGFVFRPEIGDEVVVGFLSSDPRKGVVLGSLHSSSNPAPVTGSDDNHEKAYVSRSGVRIDVNDDLKTFSITTPGGHTFLMSDDEQSIKLEDSHGNKIVMDSNGIEIESIKDLKLKSAVDAKLEAGANAELGASANLKLSGSGGAELSSSGSAKVSGSIVQIN